MLRTGVLVVACAAVVHRLQRLSIASTKRKANDGRLISSPDETGAQAFVVNSQKNVELYCRRWGSPSASPTAAFLLFHSELLSGTVFKRFAQKMMDKGYVVYAMDLTGYGKSGWQRGIPSHIECYTDYVDDIAALVKVAKRETEDVPIVMYGEGLGATCALAYALNDASNAANVDALIAASAKLQPAISTERAEHGIYGILSKILPSFSGPREDPPYDIAGLFVDAEIGMIARSNFENLQPASLQKIREVAKMCAFVQSHMTELTVPLMVLHGKDDVRNEMKFSEELKMKAGSIQKYIRLYPDAVHGLLYSIPATVDRVIADITAFVDNIITTSPRHTS